MRYAFMWSYCKNVIHILRHTIYSDKDNRKSKAFRSKWKHASFKHEIVSYLCHYTISGNYFIVPAFRTIIRKHHVTVSGQCVWGALPLPIRSNTYFASFKRGISELLCVTIHLVVSFTIVVFFFLLLFLHSFSVSFISSSELHHYLLLIFFSVIFT